MEIYNSYCGGTKDPYIEHQVAGSQIISYHREVRSKSFLEAIFNKATAIKNTYTFPVNSKSKLRNIYFESATGKGYCTVVNDTQKETYYIYENAAEFVQKLKSRGAQIDEQNPYDL